MHTPSARRLAATLSLLLLLTAGLYGLMNMSYPWSLVHQTVTWSTQLIMQFTSADFVLRDPAVVQQALGNYQRALGSISTHTLLGGLGLFLCSVQFVPGWRQRAPRLHRLIGRVAGLAVGASMVGAMAFLWQTPAAKVFSGEPFAAALWVQASTTLFALGMAVQTARQRKLRQHMGWMALLMASLLTAPLLRIGYIVLGNLLPFDQLHANAGLTVMLFPLAILTMAWWMQQVGRHELGTLPTQLSMPWSGVRVMGALGALTVVHEGLLAPQGFDLLAHWRSPAERLPQVAALWALASCAVLPRIQAALRDALWDEPLAFDLLAVQALAAMGALLVATALPSQTPNQVGALFFWGFSGVYGLASALAGLLWRGRGPQHRVWRSLVLMSWLTPATWLPTAAVLALTGWSFAAVQTSVYILGLGYTFWQGFVTAFGLPMPGLKPEAVPARPARAVVGGQPPAAAH